MIVVDTSVIVAVLKAEPDERSFTDAMMRTPRLVMSAGNYLECAIVIVSRGLQSRAALDQWLRDFRIDVTSIDFGLAQAAADAFARFGRGHHPAGLNYGDCFAYALARRLDAPLLYKGDDFSRTDVRSALGN